MTPAGLFLTGALCASLVAGLLAHQLTLWALARVPLLHSPWVPGVRSRTARGKLPPIPLPWVLGLLTSLSVMVWFDYGWGSLGFIGVVLAWYGTIRGPHLWSSFKDRRRMERMEGLFPQALGMSIQALKTGQTMPQVLLYLSTECPSPLKEEWSLVCSQMDLGSSAEDALASMGGKYPSWGAFQQFLECYRISRKTGANLTHLLETLLEGSEEKERILRRMRSMTAQARLSGLLMGVLPFFLAVVFFVMDPDLMTPLFTEKAGWAILLVAAVLEALGFLWIRHLLELEI